MKQLLGCILYQWTSLNLNYKNDIRNNEPVKDISACCSKIRPPNDAQGNTAGIEATKKSVTVFFEKTDVT